MKLGIHSLGKNTSGSVAPTVALSMFALVAAGGIAFDYAHMASLDTELQDAADQAALAAVTQLDGHPGAIKAATDVAQSLLTNRTLFANDANSSGTAVTIPTVTFYQTASDAEANANGFTDPTRYAEAHFVRVAVAARRAIFALTPVVGAVTSGDLSGQAVAGLRSAICKIPPLLLCNPAETASNLDMNPAAYIGKGIKLVAQGGSGAWAPGDFGYMQNGATGNGAPGLRELLGWNVIPGNCINVTEGDTKPGLNDTVINAFNTRFDMFDNGSGDSCPSGGACSPGLSTVKDVVRPTTGASCTYGNGGNGWQLPANYYGTGNFPSASGAVTVPAKAAMGFPRDNCHARSSGGSCSAGRIGDGAWDSNAYFQVNYQRSGGTYWTSGNGVGSWRKNTGLPANATRYAVYSWEVSHALQAVDGVVVLGPRSVSTTGGTTLATYGTRQCGAAAPATIPDRRRLSIAVSNCNAENVHGNSTNVPIIRWVDVFLVEPSVNRARTQKGDIYVEVIGETTGSTTTTTAGGQVTRRDVPYLIQ